MITVIASTDQVRPQPNSSAPQPMLPGRPEPPEPSARARTPLKTSSAPIAATVNPWSSLMNTSGMAHSAVARTRPRTSADSANASSGTASAISWKSKSIICCRLQQKP